MTGLGYSVFNIYDNCDFDIRMLLQQVRSHKPEFDVREPNHLMSIAYRDPNDTSGKQRLLRFVKNSANDQKHTTFYLWDTYVNNPDSITEAYETYAYGPSNIYLQDIADQNLVDLYAKDYYAVQPLYGKDSWEDKTNNPARNYRTAADAAAKDVTNYLYNRDKWHNRTFPTDMWNSPVVMFRMTGEQVKRFILNSYRKNGGHPSYVSGMTYRVSDDGKSVWINMEGTSFSTKKVYKVAFNSYMASTVNIESVDDGRSLFRTSEEMMIDFLLKHKEVDYQGVTRTK